MNREPKVYLSLVDHKHFRVNVARAVNVTSDSLNEIEKYCFDNKVVLLIARCQVDEIYTAQLMEQQGFFLTDTLMYYRCDESRLLVVKNKSLNIKVRAIEPKEENFVQQIAKKAFAGYPSHYHADKNLNRIKCDTAYASWAFDLCVSRNDTDEVFVALDENKIVGFGAVRLNSPVQGEGVLFAVAPNSQKKGVFGELLSHSVEWCVRRGIKEMIYSTQITNVPVQKILVRHGFELQYACYTFHKWFTKI